MSLDTIPYKEAGDLTFQLTRRLGLTMPPKKKHSATGKGDAPKPTTATVPAAAAEGYYMDSLGFLAMDSNVPGLSQVILRKLNMRNYEEYRAAMDGKKATPDFGIRTYFDMFQKMEDTYKFCVECKKLPENLSDPRSLRRCKRCQNVYYCGSECQRANWPVHKKFCKKLQLAATDRLVEWLVFTGDIPFPTGPWGKPVTEVTGWDDWFSMQDNLEEKLDCIMTGRYMNILWSNAGKPRPERKELLESVKHLVSDFLSRPLTIGFGLKAFNIEPYAGPITVHVVGASYIETLNTRVTDYDELARMFPGNQGIEVVMVGPEVVDGPLMRPPLAAFGPRGRVYLSSYRGLYHVFWETLVESQQAARPNLVVGFHPGFHASQGLAEGWLPTLLLLRDYNIPTIFTVYNEQELKYSLQILAELETRILSHGPNPFASLKLDQVQSDPNKSPVHSNAYQIRFLGLSGAEQEDDMEDLDEET